MRIGIDVDGVLTNMEKFQIEKGEEFFKTAPQNLKGYEIAEVFEVTKKEDDDFWNKYFYDYAQKEPARENASKVIKKLKDDGNEVYIVTARYLTASETKRGKEMREILQDWLKDNNIYYDEIVFTPEDKLESCKKNSIDLMIEDKVDNIVKLSTIIPVICFNARYNEDVKGQNIYRCYDWNDIYEILKKGLKNENR